jgi:5'-nucleotidase
MKILLSNDDGLYAQGLQVMGQTLADIAKVYVITPEEEQNGAGHGITMRRHLYARQKNLPFAAKAWAVNGLPADCIKLALANNCRFYV